MLTRRLGNVISREISLVAHINNERRQCTPKYSNSEQPFGINEIGYLQRSVRQKTFSVLVDYTTVTRLYGPQTRLTR